jgi:hypothetical protein
MKLITMSQNSLEVAPSSSTDVQCPTSYVLPSVS